GGSPHHPASRFGYLLIVASPPSHSLPSLLFFLFFFFNDTATPDLYTLSLHDALPICSARSSAIIIRAPRAPGACADPACSASAKDRKSTRLNSSHVAISYAVFCLKKKKLNEGEAGLCKIRFVFHSFQVFISYRIFVRG